MWIAAHVTEASSQSGARTSAAHKIRSLRVLREMGMPARLRDIPAGTLQVREKLHLAKMVR